jgi:phosphoglycerate dehydrogenase-like enzyme
MIRKLLVPTTVQLDFTPPVDVELVPYAPAAPIDRAHEDAFGLVVWGTPDELLKDAASRLRSLRWVQALSAGTDNVVRAGFGPEVVITSGRGLHDRPVAEHTLALVLAAARRVHTLVRAQIGHRWAGEIGGRQAEPSPGLFSTLRGARVLIWGFGSIAGELAPHLIALGAGVTGVATSPRERDGVRVVGVEDIGQHLPETDVLIMILPETASTKKALNAGLLALLPRHAWVVNVGRGSTLDEDALLAALRSGALAGAALDVTAVEPLPADSPLWDEPNVLLTPHAAGGRPLNPGPLIAENLQAVLDGRPLMNVVER